MSIAFGVVLGAFPVVGTSTPLCIAATLVFRLNPAIIQVVNYLAYPLQIALLVPFIRLGAWVFGREPLALSWSGIVALFQEDLIQALTTLWTAMLYAVGAWLVTGTLSVLLLYLALTPILRRFGSRFSRSGAPPVSAGPL